MNPSAYPAREKTDHLLLEQCRSGNQNAWTDLIHRYKRVVYSVAVRHRLCPEDAADVSQQVWLKAVAELPQAWQWHARAEREQAVNLALSRLPPRCQHLVRMLFCEDPPTPYHRCAGALGLALGSIGFIRGRCLLKLRGHLIQLGFGNQAGSNRIVTVGGDPGAHLTADRSQSPRARRLTAR